MGTTDGYGVHPWGMFRSDAQNTGMSPYSAEHNDGSQRWTYDVGANLTGSPVVDSNGTVFITTDEGYIHSISEEGVLNWNHQISWGIPSGIALAADGTVYVATTGIGIYAYTPKGALLWSDTLPVVAWVDPPTVSVDGSVIFVRWDGWVYRYSPDGTWGGWKSLEGRGTPAIMDNGSILMAIRGTTHLKWFGTDGDVWRVLETTGVCTGATAIDYDEEMDTVVVLSTHDNGGLVETFTLSGVYLYQVDFPSPAVGFPAIGPNGMIHVLCENGLLYAINSVGELEWTVDCGNASATSPVTDTHGTVFVANGDGELLAVSPSGEVLWRFTAGGDITSSLAIDRDGIVYFGADDGLLYAVGREASSPIPWWVYLSIFVVLLFGTLGIVTSSLYFRKVHQRGRREKEDARGDEEAIVEMVEESTWDAPAERDGGEGE